MQYDLPAESFGQHGDELPELGDREFLKHRIFERGVEVSFAHFHLGRLECIDFRTADFCFGAVAGAFGGRILAGNPFIGVDAKSSRSALLIDRNI
jgi:hypothetical protein